MTHFNKKMTVKFLTLLIALIVECVTLDRPSYAAEKECLDFFTSLNKNPSSLEKTPSKKSTEIRIAYSSYLKDVSPEEEETVISLIAAAEEKYPRTKVLEELKSAMTRCEVGAK